MSSLTTGRVAEVAEVPIGTVYRYFRDRDELVRAIVGRHRYEMDEAVSAEILGVQVESWREAVRAIVDAVARCARKRPGYLELRALAQASLSVRQEEASHRWIRAMMDAPVAELFPRLPKEHTARCAATIVAAVQGMLPRLYDANEAELEELLDDTQMLVCSYVETFARSRGLALEN